MRSLILFLHDQKGAVTIEFTLFVPLFVMLMVFFADASIIYLTHSEMYNVARDTARRMSTEQLTTEAEVETYAAKHLHLGQRTYLIDPDFEGDMRVRVMLPIGEAAIFGAWFKAIIGNYLIASATMRREPLN